jgi:hypothetical protein
LEARRVSEGNAEVGEADALAPVFVEWHTEARPSTVPKFRTPLQPTELGPPPNGGAVQQLDNSLSDVLLSTSRRSTPRDLWDSALLDILG